LPKKRHNGYNASVRHRVGIRDLRDHLSRWVERVKGGDEVVVTDHGRPVARLTLPGEAVEARTLEEHLQRLEEEGLVVLPTRPLRPRGPVAVPGVRLSDAVLGEREERR
jgi:antitoxin (DNA-binding transcriptional repressor) of toxin-antitoxin stability system